MTRAGTTRAGTMRAGTATPGTTRPTRALLLPLVAAAVLHLLVRTTGGGWLALGSAAALALPVVALLLRPRLDGLEVTATAERAAAGGSVRLHLQVTAVRASAGCRLVLADGLLAGAVVAVPALAAGASTGAVLSLAAPARGTADGLDAELASTAPLGLLRTRRRLRVPVRVVVQPVPATPGGVAGSGTGAAAQTGLAGAGTEVLGLRPWRSGDAVTALHARSTARHGRPVVLERERDQGPRLVLLAGLPGTGPAWEQQVSRAAAVCLQALAAGGEPVLVGAAPAPRPSRDGVLDWFAGLEAAGPTSAADVARAVRDAGRGGTVLLLGGAPSGLAGVRVARL